MFLEVSNPPELNAGTRGHPYPAVFARDAGGGRSRPYSALSCWMVPSATCAGGLRSAFGQAHSDSTSAEEQSYGKALVLEIDPLGSLAPSSRAVCRERRSNPQEIPSRAGGQFLVLSGIGGRLRRSPKASVSPSIQTSGDILPTGEIIDLVAPDSAAGESSLVLWQGARAEVRRRFEFGGRP